MTRRPILTYDAYIPIRPRPFDRTGAEVTTARGNRIRVNSAHYRDFKKNAAEAIAAHGRYRPLIGAVALDLELSADGFHIRAAVLEGQELRRTESGLTGDTDNYAKAILDAMQLAGTLRNDSQVVDLAARLIPRSVNQ